jgi:capsular exopolysaccharide synthesis family protein
MSAAMSGREALLIGGTGGRRGAARFLVAHLGWILLVTVVVTAGAAALSWSRTPMYKSVADVVVEPHSYSKGSAPQAPDMGTEKAIASSGTVLAIASQLIGVAPDELAKHLSVSVPPDANVLEIAYSYPNALEARRRAQGLALAYVKNANRLVGAETPIAAVITSASLPSSPSSPNHLVDIGAAVVVGLLLGLGSAAVRDLLDDRLRDEGDLEGRVRAPVLAVVRGPRRKADAHPLVVPSPDSAAAEAYRDLRTRLLQIAGRRSARTLLVTSPIGEDKPAVAANIAAAMALSGRRVVLMCADLRSSAAQRIFGFDNRVGLTSLISGNCALKTALKPTPGGLLVVPPGPPLKDPGSLPSNPALVQVLADLCNDADFVVIEAPPLLRSADGAALTDLAKMIVLVVDAQVSTRHQIEDAMRQIGPAQDKLIGCVLTNAGARRWWPSRRSAAVRRVTDSSIAEAGPRSSSERHGTARGSLRSAARLR